MLDLSFMAKPTPTTAATWVSKYAADRAAWIVAAEQAIDAAHRAECLRLADAAGQRMHDAEKQFKECNR